MTLTAWLRRLLARSCFEDRVSRELKQVAGSVDVPVPEPRFAQNPYADRSPFRSLEETRDT